MPAEALLTAAFDDMREELRAGGRVSGGTVVTGRIV
jgi:hypothetical protein